MNDNLKGFLIIYFVCMFISSTILYLLFRKNKYLTYGDLSELGFWWTFIPGCNIIYSIQVVIIGILAVIQSTTDKIKKIKDRKIWN